MSDSNFSLGSFRNLQHADTTLQILLMLKETNKAVLKACGVMLDAPSYDGDNLTAYAQGVMDDQTSTLRDIDEVTAIIDEMKDIEKMSHE